MANRITYSPAEFAALFNRERTWAYRQIYAQKVKTITEFGRIMIPAAEVERVLASAHEYGWTVKKKKKQKNSNGKAPDKSAWRNHLRNKKHAPPKNSDKKSAKQKIAQIFKGKSAVRKKAMQRIFQ
ncbi:MAG: hypothetical protein AAF591_14480 [Verrucomicrobiota bacterium]